ncbi:MAG: hypothetical protein ABIH52_01260 [Candidatus Aenigmatarchaeota archaeon]
MAKVVYIIPGFTGNTRLEGYQRVMKYFKSQDIRSIPVNISWKYKTMSDYIKQFMNQYKETRDEVYLFGFSYGAMIALISSIKINPRKLFLCSLSPFFKEDLRYLKKSWKKRYGKKRLEDFKNFSFNDIAKQIKCEVVLFAGNKEYQDVLRRVDDASRKFKNNKLIIAKGARHNILQDEYSQTLKQYISKL